MCRSYRAATIRQIVDPLHVLHHSGECSPEINHDHPPLFPLEISASQLREYRIRRRDDDDPADAVAERRVEVADDLQRRRQHDLGQVMRVAPRRTQPLDLLRIARPQTRRMRRDGVRYGLQTMCEGGGMANATVLELL